MRRRGPVLCLVLAVALAAAAVACALTSAQGSAGGRAAAAVMYGLVVAVPTLIGVLVLLGNPADRFARALYATGVLWSVVALASSSNPVLYSTGRVAYWAVLPSLVFLLLAFPSGRLTARPERIVMATVGAIAAVLYVPTALLVRSYVTPFPGAPCGQHCPDNAFAVTSSTPGFLDVVRPGRELLTVLAFFAVVVILDRRLRAAAPLLSRAQGPVTAVAAAWAVTDAA